MFHRHDAGFFGGLHGFARGRFDRLTVALARVNVFRVSELLLCFGERSGGVFVGERDMRNAQGVARFKKFERCFAVDAEDGVLDFRVGRGINAPAQKLVACVDIFDFAQRGGANDVFENDGITRLVHGKIRFRRDDHAEGLHIRDGFDFAAAVLQHHFAQVYGAALRRNGPQDEGQIFEAEFGGFFQPQESRVDLDAVAFILHFRFAAGRGHQFGALKIDLGGAAGAAVGHGLGGPGDAFCGESGRGRLAERGPGERAKHSSECEKSRCDFHVILPNSPQRRIHLASRPFSTRMAEPHPIGLDAPCLKSVFDVL